MTVGEIVAGIISAFLVGDHLQAAEQRSPPPIDTSAGGWRPSRWLEWSDVKQVDAAVRDIAGTGMALTHQVTIKPPSGNDR